MTNAEKFKEVFGFMPNEDLECPMPTGICYAHNEICASPQGDCPHFLWWNQEYKKPCCGTCKHHHFEDVDRGWVCCNAESEKCADWTERDDWCKEWEGRE